MNINENRGEGNGKEAAELLLLDLIANHLAICSQIIIIYHLYDSVLIRCA